MYAMKNEVKKDFRKGYKKFVAVGLVVMVLIGSFHSSAGILEVFAVTNSATAKTVTTEIAPTIRMGDNSPMIRDEFLKWANQRGIRHLNIDGRIYPAGIFFNGNSGKSFSYGELNGAILYISPRLGVVSESRIIFIQEMPCEIEIYRNRREFTPIIFTSPTPIHFSYNELAIMIENVPHKNPMDVRSAIILPNRRLTEYELAEWIAEYNEMGGATALELAVIQEVNRVRANYGLHPLALDPALMLSARLKAQEFGDLQYFDHYSPVHGTVTDAALMFGFEGWGTAEAISLSGSNSRGVPVFRSNAERVVGGQLASTRGHRDNLLHPRAYSVGFGAFFSPNSTGRNGNLNYAFYVVTKFGFFD